MTISTLRIWHELDINLDLNSNIAQSKYYSYHLLHPIQQVRNKNVKLSKCFRYWIYCIHFQIQDSSQDWDLVCHKTNVVHSVPSEYSYFFCNWCGIISSWVDLLMCRILEFSKYYVIFIYFQAAVSALLAVSVLYVEKKSK